MIPFANTPKIHVKHNSPFKLISEDAGDNGHKSSNDRGPSHICAGPSFPVLAPYLSLFQRGSLRSKFSNERQSYFYLKSSINFQSPGSSGAISFRALIAVSLQSSQ